MPRRFALIAALLALATASGAWADRDHQPRDSYQHHRRDDRPQYPHQRRILPQGEIMQSTGFIHRSRGYRDDDRDDEHRRDRGYERHYRDQEGDRYQPASGRPQRSVNDVIREVEGRYGGKVVGVQTVQGPTGPAYRVRVLQRDGRVKTMVVPGH